jgi:hypothetical protein
MKNFLYKFLAAWILRPYFGKILYRVDARNLGRIKFKKDFGFNYHLIYDTVDPNFRELISKYFFILSSCLIACTVGIITFGITVAVTSTLVTFLLFILANYSMVVYFRRQLDLENKPNLTLLNPVKMKNDEDLDVPHYYVHITPDPLYQKPPPKKKK